MDDKTLVERQMVAGDIHAGTYADLNRQIAALQSRNEALEAALREVATAYNGHAAQIIAKQALESQP